jgi:hypothetical protein
MKLPHPIITALVVGAFAGGGIQSVSHPVAALAQTATSAASPVDATSKALATRLNALTSENLSVDRGYADAMSALQPAILKLCRTEISSGSDPELREAARHILTIQQENDEYIRRLNEMYHIDHSG